MKKIFGLLILLATLVMYACKDDDEKEPVNPPSPETDTTKQENQDTTKIDPLPDPEVVVVDTVAPKLVSSTPANEAVDVELSGKVELVFDEDVKIIGDDPECYIGYGMGQSTKVKPVADGKTVTIEYSDLMSGTAYYLRIVAGVIADTAGNAISELTMVAFTTKAVADETAPQLVKTSPLDEATDVPLTGKLQLVFSEAVKMTKDDIKCTFTTEGEDALSFGASAKGNIVTIEYTALAADREYVCRIEGNSISDLSDNAIANALQVKFKTASVNAGSFVVTTSLTGEMYYDGRTVQIGLAGSTEAVAEAVFDGNGKAVINTDLGQFAGKEVWFCVPKLAKFFHKFTDAESAAGAVILPDKDDGSTVDASGLKNDWIVALYIGIDNAAGAPLYWASGNLIAVKTNGAGGKSEVAYHIATADESEEEGSTAGSFIMMNDKLVANVPDGYAALPAGSKWDMFAFGDPTGLRLYDYDEKDLEKSKIDQYCIELGQMAEDKSEESVVFNICGDERFDAARAQLGGLWRLPTGDKTGYNELSAFEDSEPTYAGITPNGAPYGTPRVNFGMAYAYSVDGVTTNTLKLPAAGFRHATEMAQGTSMFCLYWSGSADPTGTPGYEAVEGGGGEIVDKTGQTVDIWHTAYGYGFMARQKMWFIHPRTSSQCIRPVTE